MQQRPSQTNDLDELRMQLDMMTESEALDDYSPRSSIYQNYSKNYQLDLTKQHTLPPMKSQTQNLLTQHSASQQERLVSFSIPNAFGGPGQFKVDLANKGVQTDQSFFKRKTTTSQTDEHLNAAMSERSFRESQVKFHDLTAFVDNQAVLIERLSFGLKPKYFERSSEVSESEEKRSLTSEPV